MWLPPTPHLRNNPGAAPRPSLSKVPSNNSYAGLYLHLESRRSSNSGGTAVGIGICVGGAGVEVVVGAGMELAGGVDRDECADVDVDGGPFVVVFVVVVAEDGGMSSAGLGNVLYVEPRDVYLRVHGGRQIGYKPNSERDETR